MSSPAMPYNMKSEPSGQRSSGEGAGAKTSPMMEQYWEIKGRHLDSLLFYRMGDFYELFFEDAEIAAKALGIVLTRRGKHQGEDIPMCGVPVERAQDYLHRLIGQGHKVAVCEQIEEPGEARKRGPKSVVRREVRRLVTPGTITEDPLLDPVRANRLLAVSRARADAGGAGGDRNRDAWTYGLAALDISTGEFLVSETSEALLEAQIARIDPAEIVIPEALADLPVLRRLAKEAKTPVTPLGRDVGGDGSAQRRIAGFYQIATLDGLGALSPAELAAAAAALLYVERTQLSARPALGFPTRVAADCHMAIDVATRTNLELSRALGGGREGTLLAALDRSVTPAGARLLAERLAAPLTDPAAIARRQDAVAFFVGEPTLRLAIRRRLKAAPDPLRALSRLALQRGGPRDLACLRDALFAARDLAGALSATTALPDELSADCAAASAPDPALARRFAEMLADAPPLNRRDGDFIRTGVDRDLDELRALRDETRTVVAALQARYCELAETRQLKLKHNNFLGFFLETSRAQGERLLRPPFDGVFVHRQTMADAMRFSTAELGELETRISGAADQAIAREQALFDDLAALAVEAAEAIRAAAAALARIDASAALAEAAVDCGWVRPQVDRSLAFSIEGGRHPVVEAALRREGAPFVANDCRLSGLAGEGGRIALVTGPNMAGKSTYLRQNALIAVMAQVGSFVPARAAHIGVVDRLFSRVGASDDLARGRSTFMVEMVETAAILNSAGERALVILDEIGRGTATFDGLSIAWAVIEHLHESNRSRALFATHFHELTQLGRRLRRIDNLTVRVSEWKGDVVFLHEIMPGAAEQSYGVQVARLAGLPPAVVARAKRLLTEFEATERLNPSERLLADLPLFSAGSGRAATPEPRDELTAALDAIEPDDLTPREALEALYRLKAARSGR